MKKLIISVIATIFCGLTLKVSAQEPHIVNFNVNEVIQYYNNQLSFCDFDSITGVVIQRDTTSIKPGVVWIDANGNHTFGEYVTITEENDGQLVYIEMDSIIDLNDGSFHYVHDGYIIMDDAGQFMYCSMENFLPDTLSIKLIENDMPAPSSHGLWLGEGEMQQILPTPIDMGYTYCWSSTNWPIDSIFVSYDFYYNKPGGYICDMFDECLHSTYVSYFANQDAWITYVSTNLNSGKNEVHWKSYIGSAYDTIAIERNDTIIGYCEFLEEVWNDDTDNSEVQQQYSIYAIKNGEVLTGPSTWKTGLSLELSNVNPETVSLYLHMPQYENTTPLQYQVQFMQLYEKHENGLGLIRSEIPVETTELNDIENIYDTLVLGGVLWDGTEIYSNFVMPNGITRLNENEEVDRVQVFPNPVTNGRLYISSEMKNAEYTISNMLGQKVQTGIASRQISVENLTSGVYIITLHNDDAITTTTKFVVEQ